MAANDQVLCSQCIWNDLVIGSSVIQESTDLTINY